MHFKELFLLDGLKADMDDTDLGRRNTITALLEEWGLLKIVDDDIDEPRVGLNQLKILSYKDKDEWELIPKYHIGRR